MQVDLEGRRALVVGGWNRAGKKPIRLNPGHDSSDRECANRAGRGEWRVGHHFTKAPSPSGLSVILRNLPRVKHIITNSAQPSRAVTQRPEQASVPPQRVHGNLNLTRWGGRPTVLCKDEVEIGDSG